MEKVLFAWSGGKDSALALYEIQRSQRYEIVSLLTTITEGYDRVSLHGLRRTLVEQQAKSLGLPIQEVFIPKLCSNEEYESKMRQILTKFKQAGISQVVFGDIFLEDVRKYREDNLSKLEAIVICIDTRVLDQSFLGRIIDENFTAQLPPNIDPGGENGEFHSFVFDGPIFKDRIGYKLGEQVLRDSFYFCDLLPAKRQRG